MEESSQGETCERIADESAEEEELIAVVSKPVRDMTPVDVVQILLDFKPDVGGDKSKIAVSLTMRLMFTPQVSWSLTNPV